MTQSERPTREQVEAKLAHALEHLDDPYFAESYAAERALYESWLDLRARLDAAEQENKRLRSRSKPSLPSRGQREAI